MPATVAREVPARQARKRRRTVRNGEPTNVLVFSAHAGGNENIFPRILSLYAPRSSIVADVTYGEGVFWRNVPDDWYVLLGTDIQTGTDCRDLPYGDGEIDCVVLDPPYMHTPGGTAHTAHAAFEKHYRNNGTGNKTTKKYHLEGHPRWYFRGVSYPHGLPSSRLAPPQGPTTAAHSLSSAPGYTPNARIASAFTLTTTRMSASDDTGPRSSGGSKYISRTTRR